MIQIVTKLVTKMSPTYNDHFRQATKKVTKNHRFKCFRRHSKPSAVIVSQGAGRRDLHSLLSCVQAPILIWILPATFLLYHFVTSHSVDWATFAEPWQTIALSSNAKIGNTNYHTQNNRWRYLQGRQFIEIELNVGPADGSQVSAGTQFIFANISQAPFLANGWFRIVGTGQSSTLGSFEFNKVNGQTNNIRYVPVTGATNYLACHEIIPNPSA